MEPHYERNRHCLYGSNSSTAGKYVKGGVGATFRVIFSFLPSLCDQCPFWIVESFQSIDRNLPQFLALR